MAEILTEAQLLATFSGGQPEQIAMQNLIRSLFARKEGVVNASESVAGLVGEYLSTSVLIADKISLVSDTPKTVAALVLTAGDWDVNGVVAYVPAATTSITYLRQSISTTTNTDGAAIASYADHAHTPGATNVPIRVAPLTRINISAQTTYYLVAHGIFATDTLSAYGLLQARRVR
jgi:hypothetical protein